MTLFILLMGYPPFSGESQSELLQQTVHERVHYEEKDWSALSRDALILVKNMLCKNPDERISMREVLSFPWVTNPPASVGSREVVLSCRARSGSIRGG